MNEWDRDNLEFIMNTTDESFDEWLDQADNDDIDYALELIRMAKAELMIQEMEMTDTVSNFTEANQLIERIKNV
jgi:putative SOS response-associated peptidase YedK